MTIFWLLLTQLKRPWRGKLKGNNHKVDHNSGGWIILKQTCRNFKLETEGAKRNRVGKITEEAKPLEIKRVIRRVLTGGVVWRKGRGIPRTKWQEAVERNLAAPEIRDWRRATRNRERRRRICSRDYKLTRCGELKTAWKMLYHYK